ncbi:putative F-box domain-containing protein [Helianthus debilis subsp. tardiflorus]
MVDFLPDDVLCNIIARLPAKPLLRFRCVSKYWNHMLTEPNFMKLRSRKTIILPLHNTFHLIDDNVLNDDMPNLIVKRCYPLVDESRDMKVIGTLNGIVVIQSHPNIFMLYNPFTGVSELLPFPPTYYKGAACGFGYGPTPDDLKIIRFRQYQKDFDVYNFRESSWSSLSTSENNMWISFEQLIGHFLNGSLYWLATMEYGDNMLIAVDVKDLVLSEICLPFEIKRGWYLTPLGTINGCLCSLNQITDSKFDMWVMKEHDQWSKIYSLELPLNEMTYDALCILDGRRILMVDSSKNLIIYDTLKKWYKRFNISIKNVHLYRVHALEYVESLVSPLDMCSSRLEQTR